MNTRRNCVINVLIFVMFACVTTNVLANNEKKPPALKFKVNQKEFFLGDTCIATWNQAAVKSIKFSIVKKLPSGEKISQDSIIKNTGQFYYIPKENVQLKFIFDTREKEPVNRNIKIELLLPKISVAKSSSDSINDETEITLAWEINNVAYVTINNALQKYNASDSILLRPDTTTIYKIQAVNKNGIVVDTTLCVKVTQIEYCNTPKDCFVGEKLLIKWKYLKCDSVVTSLVSSTFKGVDKLEYIMPKNNITVYFKVFKNNGVIDTFSRRIYFKESIIKYITAPDSVLHGAAVKIQWDCDGCSYVTISDVDKKFGAKSSYVTNQFEDKTYVLRFYDLVGNLAETKNIVVKIAKNRAFVKGIIHAKNLVKDIQVDCEIIGVDYYKFPNEVTLKVIAVDTSGNFISGLSIKDKESIFKSLVENMEDVDSFAINDFKVKEISKQEPYLISVVIDYSGSIRSEVDDIDKSFKKFVQNKRPLDKISIIKFDSRITYASPYFDNKDSIMAYYNKYKYANFGQSTALYAAIDRGYKSLHFINKNNAIIVLTDGNENSSLMFIDSLDCDPNIIVSKSRDKKVKIITVGYGNGVNKPVLQALAHLTGSNNYQISRPKDILDVFQEIPIILNNYYEITYKPISKHGTHTVQLQFDNNRGKIASTSSDYCTDNSFYIQDYEGNLMKQYDTLIVRLIKKSNLKCKPATIEQAKYLRDLRPLWASSPQLLAQYKTNRAVLDTAQFKLALTHVSQILKNDPSSCIILFGHTDTKGSKKDCYILSRQRAEVAKKFLVEQGVDENRILVHGCGKSLPIWKDDKDDNLAKENRRVEYVIIK